MNKKNIYLASSFVILTMIASQTIRLGSNLFVTRLLAPEIFGVLSLVYVLIVGLSMFSDLGLWAYIVRHKTYEDENLLNAVWTLQVIRGWLIFFFVIILSLTLFYLNIVLKGFLHGIYAEPQLPLLILTAGISSVINGYKSMASPVMHRKLIIGRIEFADVFSQVVGTTIMLLWAWMYPTVWSLLSVGIISSTINTILSYKLFPYRHKITWDKNINKEVYQFSKWIVVSSALTFLFTQSDRLFFAAKIDASILGVYSIALMLTASIIALTENLASKIIYPVLSTHGESDRSILKDYFYKARLYSDSPIFFACGFLMAAAPYLISILYDERYYQAGSMLRILLFMVVGNTLSVVSLECLSALSVTKIRMWVMLIRTSGLLIGLPFFFHFFGYYGAICVVALNVWLPIPLVYRALHQNKIFSIYKEIRTLPIIAVGYFTGLLFI